MNVKDFDYHLQVYSLCLVITAIMRFGMTIPCLMAKINMCNGFNSRIVAVNGGHLTKV